MNDQELYSAEIDLALACFEKGDWRGVIAAMQDARQRAKENGHSLLYMQCDVYLARTELWLKQKATKLGVQVKDLDTWETTA